LLRPFISVLNRDLREPMFIKQAPDLVVDRLPDAGWVNTRCKLHIYLPKVVEAG
jgi:hypothetical protein